MSKPVDITTLVITAICLCLAGICLFAHLSHRRRHSIRYLPSRIPKNLGDMFPFQPGIPQIIHQTAPEDIKKWHPHWSSCQASWGKIFPEYTYMLWNDDDLEKLIREDFPWFLPTYLAYPRHIKRVDACRYFILYKYGGIYADMDYEVFRHFAHLLPPDKVSVCESPYKENENCQNALMASPVGHPFWLVVFRSLFRWRDYKNVLKSTGPILLDYAIEKDGTGKVHILPHDQFNPHRENQEFENTSLLYTRHHGTMVWLSKEKGTAFQCARARSHNLAGVNFAP
jgi:mannosyltransferase OCH1-like enzyme